MTEAQIKMARHALGLVDGRATSYRNRYVAGLGTTQESDWDAMVRHGYAARGNDRIAVVGFCLTDAGANAVLRPGETLDREDFPGARAALTEETGGERPDPER